MSRRTWSMALLAALFSSLALPAAAAPDAVTASVPAEGGDAGDAEAPATVSYLPPQFSMLDVGCRYVEDHYRGSCNVAPGSIRHRWIIDQDPERPIATISASVWLREDAWPTGSRRFTDVRRSTRLAPDATEVVFEDLPIGWHGEFTLIVAGPSDAEIVHERTVRDHFRVRDMLPAALLVGQPEPTAPARIRVPVHTEEHPAVLPVVRYELQRNSGAGWVTAATGTYRTAGPRTAWIQDDGCPARTLCSYRFRNTAVFGTGVWSPTLRARSLPLPSAPTITARASAAGRIEVTARPTTSGDGGWYVDQRYELQRDIGGGWTTWTSGRWSTMPPGTLVRTDTTCPVSTVCRYRVRTTHTVGRSAYASVSQRSMAAPRAPRSVAATSPRSRTVKVTWQAPIADAGRPVHRYEVWSGGTRRWVGTERSATFSLPAGTRTVEVRAVNPWGASPSVARQVTVRR